MLRISSTVTDKDVCRLELSGNVTGPWVAELSAVVEERLRGGRHVTLDFGGVAYVSSDGAALIRSLRARGIECVGTSRFVDELLGRANP